MDSSCRSLRRALTRIDARSLLTRKGVVRTRAGLPPSSRTFRSPCRSLVLAFTGDSRLSCWDSPYVRAISARYASSSKNGNNEKPNEQDDDGIPQPPLPTPPVLSYRQQARSPPNVITLTRIACTPLLSYCILHDYSTAALVGCFLAGASDLLDGWLARNFQQTTVLGTYLDPLADKILVNTLSVSLWYQVILPTPLVLLWLTRDVALMVGSYKYVVHSESKTTDSVKNDGESSNISLDQPSPSKQQNTQPLTLESTRTWFNLPRTTLQVKPSTVSKVNTALQFLTLGAAIASPMYMDPTAVDGDVLTYAASWDDNYLLQSLCWMTGATTIASGFDYLRRDVFKK